MKINGLFLVCLLSLLPVYVLIACSQAFDPGSILPATKTATNPAALPGTDQNIPGTIPPAVATGTIYYVSPGGNDANPGTLSQPWKTPAKAGFTAQAGDTVIFRAGTYYSQLTPKNSGNPTNGWITFKAFSGEQPVIIHDAFYSKAVNLDGVSYINVIGLTAIAAGANGPGIGINNAHHITILNCVAKDSATSGIATTNSIDYITIEGNRIYGNANTGQYNGSGISLWNSGGPMFDSAPGYHNIIRNNLIYNNRNLTDTPSDGNGIILDNNDLGGTAAQQFPKTLVANNIIFGNGGRCIHVRNSSNTDVVNNTCYHNLETERIKEGCNGEITLQRTNTYSSSVNIQVFNNVVYGIGGTCNSGRSQAFVFQVFCNSTYCPQITSGYNIWFNGASKQMGTNDVTANPLFKNPTLDAASANFSLSPNSPAIDSGTDIFKATIATDYLGNIRPQGEGFDRGAYEVGERFALLSYFLPFVAAP